MTHEGGYLSSLICSHDASERTMSRHSFTDMKRLLLSRSGQRARHVADTERLRATITRDQEPALLPQLPEASGYKVVSFLDLPGRFRLEGVSRGAKAAARSPFLWSEQFIDVTSARYLYKRAIHSLSPQEKSPFPISARNHPVPPRSKSTCAAASSTRPRRIGGTTFALVSGLKRGTRRRPLRRSRRRPS